jgi:hypothetical protein
VNRQTIINTLIALAIAALVTAVFVLEGRSDETASTTTTTSTTVLAATTTSSSTTTTSTTTSSTTSTSTTTSTVPPTTDAPLPRELWKVVVVNCSTSGERLQPTVDRLREIGYTDVRGLVGAVQTTETVIYFQFLGLESAAERLRSDLEMFDTPIVVFDEAPPVAGRSDAQLMIYLGGN